jgi:polyribonucleotide nucleotidyltransferase
VRDELKEGQQILVKVINIDPTGKIRLSRKALLAPDEGTAPPAGGEAREEAGAAAGAPREGSAGPRDRDRHGRGGRGRGPRRDREQ